MTTKELLTFFERYYGEKYTGFFREIMTAYLAKYSPDFHKAAANVLVKRFSHTFGKVPGPAEIEKHLEEIKWTIPTPKFLPEYMQDRQEISDEEREERIAFSARLKEMLNSKTYRKTDEAR